MKRFKFMPALCATFLIVGCSSPPEPISPEWEKSFTITNTAVPLWQENKNVVPSPVVTGKWSTVITDFKDDDRIRTADVWYAVAHSSHISVIAPDSAAFFNAKTWLRQHGAKGVIAYQQKTKCLTCNTTDIYFTRNYPPR